jgi:hypothetical protein
MNRGRWRTGGFLSGLGDLPMNVGRWRTGGFLEGFYQDKEIYQ